MTRKQRIGRAFGAAAPAYDAHASVQRMAAERLAEMIAARRLPSRPRILEIGCGTGFLTAAILRRLPDAEIVATDLSPAMAAACRAANPAPLYAVMDGERPCFAPGSFDVVCASLAVQWFEERAPALARLCELLRPGGVLAVSTLLSETFAEWRRAHEDEGLEPGVPDFAAPEEMQHFSCRGAALSLEHERLVEPYADGASFVRTLKAIGAGTPRSGRAALSAPDLRRVLRRFEAAGAAATYHLGYAMLQVPDVQHGAFVVGTDTDVGKTVVAACLARAWDADYWKPVQTGSAEDPGDTAAVARLTGLPPERLHAPVYVFAAPLSPHAAAALEGAAIALDAIARPSTERPLVVEGAGGALVPLNDHSLMIDLVQRLGLPVVVAARSTLGTINHTLLTLEALRGRGLRVLGVVMNGPPSASNREAIERYGRVRVLAEIPWSDSLTPEWIEQVATSVPPLHTIE